MSRSVIYLLFLTYFCQACSKQHAAYFEEISTSQARNDDHEGDFAASNLIHGSFHRCSVSEEACDFVIKDKKKNKYSLVANQKDLPERKEGYRIWQKIYMKNNVAEVKTEEKAYGSCKKACEEGINNNEAITIKLRDGSITKASCDMKRDGGGWTVFQRRIDGSVEFNRGWDDYTTGFGNVTGNFWLGLEALHQLTKEGRITLRIDLKGLNGEKGYAQYDDFTISGKEQNFTISFGDFTGDIGDSLTGMQGWRNNNGRPFSTKDRDNDDANNNGNCAKEHGGPWWYYDCSDARLNGRYPHISIITGKEMLWRNWKKSGDVNPISITFSEMKLRREN